MQKIFLYIPLLIMVAFPVIVQAHPGRTDSSGCHTCRTNCASWGLSTGEYHCHRSKGVPQPLAPVRSIQAEHVTVPAPEYAVPKNTTNVVTPRVVPIVVSTTSPKIVPSPVVPITPVKSEGWMTRFYNFIFR